MESDQPRGGARFPATRWSSLDAPVEATEERRLAVLEHFLQAYYTPLENYLRFQFRIDEHQARDYLHDFVLNRVIRKNLLAQADRTRGRFRTFLMHAVNRFVIDELRKRGAGKRSPGEPVISLEALEEGALDHVSASSQLRFDQEFARGVVHQTLLRMRERCEATDRKDLWRVFHDRVLGSAFDNQKRLPYDQLAPLLGVATHAEAANLLTSAKRMFARVFKSVIRDYEADEKAIEEETLALRHILCNS